MDYADEAVELMATKINALLSPMLEGTATIDFTKVSEYVDRAKEISVSLVDDSAAISSLYSKHFKGIYDTLYDIYDSRKSEFEVGRDYLVVMSSTNRRCDCMNVINTRLIYYLYLNHLEPSAISILYTYNSIIESQECCVPFIFHQLLTKLTDNYNLTTESSHIMKTHKGYRDGTFRDMLESPIAAEIVESSIKLEKLGIGKAEMTKLTRDTLLEMVATVDAEDITLDYITELQTLALDTTEEIYQHIKAIVDAYNEEGIDELDAALTVLFNVLNKTRKQY